MKFIIKTHLIPIVRDKNEVTLSLIERNKDNLLFEEPLTLKYSHEIPIEANKIQQYNNSQLMMAEKDITIDSVQQKTICNQ